MSACSPRTCRGAPASCRRPVRVAVRPARRSCSPPRTSSWATASAGWSDGVRDVPHPGERIAAGRPICTVLASAATPEDVRAQLEERAALLEAVAQWLTRLRRVRLRLRRRAGSHLPARRRVVGHRRAAAGRPRRRPTRSAVEEASDAAAAILEQARAPLVYGLGRTSCEAQRRAVAIAEATGAVLDPAGGSGAGLAYAAVGSSTATFGEIRDRAELVVVWRADPAVTNPRLLERACGAARRFVELDADFEALWELRARVTGAPLARPDAERSTTSPAACSTRATSRSSTARSTNSRRWRCSRSCATSTATGTRSRSRCAARATRAAPRTCSPGRPASRPR